MPAVPAYYGRPVQLKKDVIQKMDPDSDSDSKSDEEKKKKKEYINTLNKIVKSKKKKHALSRKRYPTSFGSFSKMSGKNLQGPHTQSFVSKELTYKIAEIQNRPFDELKDTYALLNPKQVNRKLKRSLSSREGEDGIRLKRHSFVKNYTSKYNQIDTISDDEEKKIHIKKMVELQPQGTFGLDTGKYTKDEIKGKGERKTNVLPDFEKVSKWNRTDPFPTGLRHFDGGDRLDDDDLDVARKQFHDMVKFGLGEELDTASASEESLSDIDDDPKKTIKKKTNTHSQTKKKKKTDIDDLLDRKSSRSKKKKKSTTNKKGTTNKKRKLSEEDKKENKKKHKKKRRIH